MLHVILICIYVIEKCISHSIVLLVYKNERSILNITKSSGTHNGQKSYPQGPGTKCSLDHAFDKLQLVISIPCDTQGNFLFVTSVIKLLKSKVKKQSEHA